MSAPERQLTPAEQTARMTAMYARQRAERRPPQTLGGVNRPPVGASRGAGATAAPASGGEWLVPEIRRLSAAIERSTQKLAYAVGGGLSLLARAVLISGVV